nr:PREDICTED: DNA-directed RNA polymerase III subunit RPC7 isoform X1 [Lepisosteus oculatus]XP_015216411.1 PREDICTED: DNA-directed RNA polymerase III subunit RPC7 isoform X1 [Lepisosteus oculatus]
MAGRGRGRGLAALTFNIEALGLTRGEALPETSFRPKPLFPDVDFKPVPLKMGEDQDYMLALKQEMRAAVKLLPYNIPLPAEKKDVEKYTKEKTREGDNTWKPDWRRLPKELMPQRKKQTKPKANKKSKPKTSAGKEEILSKLENYHWCRTWRRKMKKGNLMKKRQRRRKKRKKKRKVYRERSTMRKSWRRRMTTSPPTSKMGMIMVLAAMTTWMKPLTNLLLNYVPVKHHTCVM